MSTISRKQCLSICTGVLVTLWLVGCGGGEPAPPTATPTPPPTATATATATPSPIPGSDTTKSSTAPTPQVVIPNGFRMQVDETRGYSLATPRGWTVIDLRGQQTRNLANTFGLGEQMEPLYEFLESEAGQSVGIVAATDLGGVIFGGVPTVLNVSVIEAPGYTPESTVALVQATLADNAGLLDGIVVESVDPNAINNLPAVAGRGTIDLTDFGYDAQLYGQIVGLLANDQIYLLTLATNAENRADQQPTFDEIVGTFRPE